MTSGRDILRIERGFAARARTSQSAHTNRAVSTHEIHTIQQSIHAKYIRTSRHKHRYKPSSKCIGITYDPAVNKYEIRIDQQT